MVMLFPFSGPYTFPEIDPIALRLGPILVHWYGISYLAAFVCGLLLIDHFNRWREHPIDKNHFTAILLWMVVGVVAGGRLGYVLFYAPQHFLAHPGQIFMLGQGGMSFHGGALGVILATYLYCRRHRLEVWQMYDSLVLVVPPGLFFGRIANFVNGELWGRETDLPWGVVFPHVDSQPRHPSQLYEAFLEGVLLFAVLVAAARWGRLQERPGALAGSFLILYGIIRFGVEFVRAPDEQIGFVLGIWTLGQGLSLGLVALGGLELVLSASRKR